MKKLIIFFSLSTFSFSLISAQTMLNSKVPPTQIKTINGANTNSNTLGNLLLLIFGPPGANHALRNWMR